MAIIDKIDDFDALIKDKNILVDFYASWCGPCKMLTLELEEISIVDIIKVDIDKHMDLAKKYGIMSVPTLIYFKKDGTFTKKIGYMTKDEIINWIK